jgi:hypothetical protein
MSLVLRRWVSALMALLLWGCGGGGGDEARPLVFSVVEETAFSGVGSPATTAVQDEPSWAALWAAHAARRDPAPPRPVVDWAGQAVAAIFLGEVAACNRPRVEAIHEARGSITVRWTHVPPQPSELCIAATVRPALMVRFDNPQALPVAFTRSP